MTTPRMSYELRGCMSYALRDADADFRANAAGFHVFDRIA